MEFVFCSKCGKKNVMSVNNCQYCEHILFKEGSTIPNLKDELLEIKNKYEAKFKILLDKIEKFENAQPETEPAQSQTYISSNSILPKVAEVELNAENSKKEIEKENTEEAKPIVINKPEELYSKQEGKATTKEEAVEQEPLPNYRTKVEPSRSLKEIISSVPLLSVALEEVSAPLMNLVSFAKKTYNNYKAKNQLPVFFMTVAGIATLLFGFGYLMQLSIGYFGKLSEMVKISFGFICSSSIIFWATKLYSKSNKYKEFSSALLGLAIALNYLFIYFLSNLASITGIMSSPVTGFILIAFNTIVAIYFALRYETKIVAILSLLCGAFAPFYLNTEGSSPVYFAYLWMLSASSIYVAGKIEWKTLGVISFLASASIIELAIFNDLNSFSVYTYTIIFHAFAYLFIWFSLFNGKRITETLTKQTVILIAGNISLFLFNLYYLFSDSGYYTSLGFVYLVNALIFFPGLWMLNKHMNRNIRLLIMVIAGTFVAFAIPAIFDQHLMGLFWSVEALALVFLGFNFAMPSIRKEGYILLGIAFIRMLISLDGLWIFRVHNSIYSSAYYNLLAVGLVFALAIYLLTKYSKSLVKFEHKLLIRLSNLTAFWFAFTFTLTAAYYTTEWLSFISILASFTLIAIGYTKKLEFTRALGYIIFIACIVYSAYFAYMLIPMYWETTIVSTGYANLAVIGLFLGFQQVVIIKLHSANKKLFIQKLKHYTQPLNELLSVWFTVLFIVTAYYFIGNYALNLAILPMFALIYIGFKKKLVLTENLGLAYSILIIIGIILSVMKVNSPRFTFQTLSGKIAILELMLIMWGLKTFYNNLLTGSRKAKAMHVVREVFYWIVPLIIISPVKNNVPDYIPEAIWGSVFISFIIYEWTKCKSLIIELTILSVIAALYGLVLGSILTIPISLAVLGVILIKHKGYNRALCNISEFKHNFIASVYYLGACLFVVAQEILPSISDAFIVLSVYFSCIVIFIKRIAPLQNNYLVAFWLSLILSALSVGFKHFEHTGLADQLLSFVPLFPLGIILYSKAPIYSKKQLSKWLTLIYIYHILILTSYSLVLDKTWLTIAFTIHAIIILFNSMKPPYGKLVWQSVAFFGIAVIKLFLWDINHFTIAQKVIVFVIIGALLIGAAFLYMKLKDRYTDISLGSEEEKDES